MSNDDREINRKLFLENLQSDLCKKEGLLQIKPKTNKMEFNTNTTKLAQSASALGAGLLGFRLGVKWGNIISSYALIVIVVGAIFHIWECM